MPFDHGVGRGDLSDEEWLVLEPLLPVVGLGRRSRNRRRLIDGVRWRVRTGVPWRDLPCEYGPWRTVYGLFRRWQREGVWCCLPFKMSMGLSLRMSMWGDENALPDGVRQGI
ncbi:transposase [Streptomyces xanthophaeus]|uniref:transposase n=1 Tax=Streptomyces xanthophaeus TaxID=67385 RepID=UPI003990037B